VCAGFAQHFGWDVALVRVLMVVAVLLGFGTPILAYAVAWIAMPEGPYFVPEAAVHPATATSGSETASTS
jgi:phage shock protein C